MRILAIDPGYDRCGVAVLERVGSKVTLLASTCIQTSAQDEFYVRLMQVVRGVHDLCISHQPEVVAIETLYMTRNQKTVMRVAEVRGALLHCAASLGCTITELNPRTVKQAILGDGRGDKRQIARMVPRLISLDSVVRNDDEYDAIAIGLTAAALIRG